MGPPDPQARNRPGGDALRVVTVCSSCNDEAEGFVGGHLLACCQSALTTLIPPSILALFIRLRNCRAQNPSRPGRPAGNRRQQRQDGQAVTMAARALLAHDCLTLMVQGTT